MVLEGQTNDCDRCGDQYDSYIVFLRDDFNDISGYVNNEYDNLCKPCRMAVADYGAYLTETEREELEPKHQINE